MKKVLAVLAVVLMFSASGFASNTELQMMGGMPVVLTSLDQIIYNFPAQIGNFNNEIVLEYNNAASARGYTILNTGKGSALGLSFLPNSGYGFFSANLNTAGLVDTVAGSVPDLTLVTNVINGIYGIDLKGMKVAAEIFYGSNLTSTELLKSGANVTDKDHSGIDNTMMGIILGLGLDIGMPLDLALTVAMPNYNNNPKNYAVPPGLELTNDNYEKLSGLGVGLEARTTINAIIFDLAFNLTTLRGENRTWTDNAPYGSPDVNTVYSADDSQITVTLLAGKQIKPTDTINMIIGAGLSGYTTQDPVVLTEDKLPPGSKTYLTPADSGMVVNLPVYISADCKLNDTWRFTAGATKNVITITNNSDQTALASDHGSIQTRTDTSTWTYNSAITANIGVTGKFGDLALQLLLSNDIIRRGPNLLSGANIDVASQIALNYAWK